MSELVTDANTLITSIGALAGTIGAIIVAISSHLKAGKAKDLATKIGNGLEETDRWIAENEQKLLTVLTVTYNLTPAEQKQAAEKYAELIKKYSGDLDKVKAELDQLYGVVK